MTELYLDSHTEEERTYYESLYDHLMSLSHQAWDYLVDKYPQYLDEDGDTLNVGETYLQDNTLWLHLSDHLGDRNTDGEDTEMDWEDYGDSDLMQDYRKLYEQAEKLMHQYREYTRQYNQLAYYDRYGHYLRDPHWEYYQACWEDYGSYWPS